MYTLKFYDMCMSTINVLWLIRKHDYNNFDLINFLGKCYIIVAFLFLHYEYYVI